MCPPPPSNNLKATTRALKSLDRVLGGDLVERRASVLARRVPVHLHKLRQVELWLLEHLDLADKYVLEGEDRLALLLDLRSDGLGEGDAGKGWGMERGWKK